MRTRLGFAAITLCCGCGETTTDPRSPPPPATCAEVEAEMSARPVPSADPIWLAYRTFDALNDVQRLLVVDVAGGVPSVPFEPLPPAERRRDVEGFEWSPDGRWLAYEVKIQDEITDELRVTAFHGSAPGASVTLATRILRSVWSPTGEHLLVHLHERGWQLFDLRGDVPGKPQNVSSPEGNDGAYFGAWSPDGRWAAFYVGGVLELFDVRTGSRSRGALPMLATEEPEAFTTWSPDARRIAFRTSTGLHQPEHLHVVDVDALSAGAPSDAWLHAQIATLPGNASVRPEWTSDSRWLVWYQFEADYPSDFALVALPVADNPEAPVEFLTPWLIHDSSRYLKLQPGGTRALYRTEQDGQGFLALRELGVALGSESMIYGPTDDKFTVGAGWWGAKGSFTSFRVYGGGMSRTIWARSVSPTDGALGEAQQWATDTERLSTSSDERWVTLMGGPDEKVPSELRVLLLDGVTPVRSWSFALDFLDVPSTRSEPEWSDDSRAVGVAVEDGIAVSIVDGDAPTVPVIANLPRCDPNDGVTSWQWRPER